MAAIKIKYCLRQLDQQPPSSIELKMYDTKAGMRSEKFIYRGLTLPSKIWSRVYDAYGNVVEERLSKSDGSLIFRWTYLFDQQGRKIQGNLHDSTGNLLAIWFYDKHQQLSDC